MREASLSSEAKERNVSDLERWCCLATGGFFLLYGLLRRSLLLGGLGGYLTYRGKTGRCLVYDALGISSAEAEGKRLTFEKSIVVDRPKEEVFRFWRDVENAPRFMTYLESARSTGNGRSHWVVRAPGGIHLQWDAEITEEKEGEKIVWSSLPGSDVQSRGEVRLAALPGDRGTEVRLHVELSPPGGGMGAAAARLLESVAAEKIQQDLRRMKQILETGEIATTSHQPAGR